MTNKRHSVFAIHMGRLIQKIMAIDRSNKLHFGVTLTQAYVIGILYAKQTMSMNELSQELGVAISTLTRIVDVLVRNNWVARKASKEDRRKVCIELTENGRNLAKKLNIYTEKFWANVLQAVPDQHMSALFENIKLLNKALDQSASQCILKNICE
jgi:DNA-binding MarR family transcriptional regulator